MANDELQRIRTILKEAQADCNKARLHANVARIFASNQVFDLAASRASEASDAAWSAYERLSNLLRDIK